MSNSEARATPRKFGGLDARPGPARPLSPADTEWLIEQVVLRALEPDHKPLRRRPRLRMLSFGALAVVTSAAAGTLVHQKFAQNVITGAAATSASQRQTRRPARDGAPAQPASEPSAQPAQTAQAVPTAPFSTSAHETRSLVTTTSSARVPTQEVHESRVVDELSAANVLRRDAQWQAAEAAYRSIAARYPQAPEAAVAQLAAAELRLEHLGDAAGALRLYGAVPKNSLLGVEALSGLSRAYRALGNSAAEAETLRSLLDAYPTSLQADNARARLTQLTTKSVNP
jgi:TolA-binding protein